MKMGQTLQLCEEEIVLFILEYLLHNEAKLYPVISEVHHYNLKKYRL
jgi:hypothetical protein